MRALADLRQLLGVAKQQQPAAGLRHRQGIGEGELAGLVDHLQVQRSGGNIGSRHGPRSATNERPAGGAEEPGNVLRSAVLPGEGVRVFYLLGNHGRINAGAGHSRLEQVLYDGMGLAHDPDFPAAGHQPCDDTGTHIRLAGAGGSLHGQVRVIKVENGLGNDVNEAVRPRAGLRQRECGHQPWRQPPDEVQRRMTGNHGGSETGRHFVSQRRQ